jgi:hypothetical protein
MTQGALVEIGKGSVPQLKTALSKFITVNPQYPKAAVEVHFLYFNQPNGIQVCLPLIH